MPAPRRTDRRRRPWPRRTGRKAADATAAAPGAGTPGTTAIRDAQLAGEPRGAATTRSFPAGSYIIRMDQPYSRIADAILDYQYWSPNDPQKSPYDDTGWTFPEGFGVQCVRVTDTKVLDVPVTPVTATIIRAGRRERAAGTVPRSITTATTRSSRFATSSRTRTSRWPRSRSTRAASTSTAARSSSRTCRRPTLDDEAKTLGVKVTARRVGAEREDAPGARGARRDPAHVDRHADRRLVASGVRLRQGAVRLHQHPGRRRERRT